MSSEEGQATARTSNGRFVVERSERFAQRVFIGSKKPWPIPKSYATSSEIQRSFAALRMKAFEKIDFLCKAGKGLDLGEAFGAGEFGGMDGCGEMG